MRASCRGRPFAERDYSDAITPAATAIWPFEEMWEEDGAAKPNEERREIVEDFFHEVVAGKSLAFFRNGPGTTTIGAQGVTSLLVEGGGEVNASFLLQGLAHRIAFFYAPKILGGGDSRKAVAGEGARRLDQIINLTRLEWRRLGPDLLLTARVAKR